MPLAGFTILATGDSPIVAGAARLLGLLGAGVVWAADGGAGDVAVRQRTHLSQATHLAGLPIAGALDGAGLLVGQATPFPVLTVPTSRHPALQWAASGAMALTGDTDGPPLLAGVDATTLLESALVCARFLAKVVAWPVEGSHATLLTAGEEGDVTRDDRRRLAAVPSDLGGPRLLGERAAIAGLSRQGRTSVGGASRLFATTDGWAAVSLTRPADFELLPAWLGHAAATQDPWPAVATWMSHHSGAAAVARAQLLGIAAARLPDVPGVDEQLAARCQAWPPAPWLVDGSVPASLSTSRSAAATERSPHEEQTVVPSRHAAARPRPVVIDLSSLWAGPLCASLLEMTGARVIKVETPRRPDGARRGPRPFFDLLNAGKQSVALELGSTDGSGQLRRLIEGADVVIESSRPRVMAQWGLDPEDVIARRDGLTWISITGYGRTGPWSNRVGFGDDTSVAAGIVTRGRDQTPRFCADALADPVAGLLGAVAGLASLAGGGSHLIDVSLREAAGHLAAYAPPREPARTAGDGRGWFVEAGGQRQAVEPPTARAPTGAAPPLGRDTTAILEEFRR